jgi:hypothetical protein
MRFISASTAFESILHAYHGKGGLIMPKNVFKVLNERIADVIKYEAENKISQEDLDRMVRAIPRINEHNYRTKAKPVCTSTVTKRNLNWSLVDLSGKCANCCKVSLSIGIFLTRLLYHDRIHAFV